MTVDARLCLECGHAANDHVVGVGCRAVTERDRLGFVKELCDCGGFMYVDTQDSHAKKE